jgi:UDP:flavonoid glycosyltransferase YjiC (YdhE family)
MRKDYDLARIGLVTLGVPGHWNPTSCLGRALQSRGHEVFAFLVPFYEDVVRRSGLEYRPIGSVVFPSHRMEQIFAQMER